MRIDDRRRPDPLNSLLATPGEREAWDAGREFGHEQGLRTGKREGRKESKGLVACLRCHRKTEHAWVGEPENRLYCTKCGQRNYELSSPPTGKAP